MSFAKRLRLRGAAEKRTKLIQKFFSSIGTPKALAAWIMYRENEHDQLLDLDVNPAHYSNAHDFHLDYQVTSYLSKSQFLSTSFDKDTKCLERYAKAERQCRDTNHRVRPFTPGGYTPASELHFLIPRIRRKIERILGRFDVEEWLEACDWGPGVTNQLKGSYAVKPNKYQHETGITQEVLDVLGTTLPVAFPSWFAEIMSQRPFDVEKGNVFCAVPKNSKTHRAIFVEPGFNLFFQKGIGKMIRRRLLRFGINLRDQTRNQTLSSFAHTLGLATIDFSMASDTVAKEVVRLLIPHAWLRVMELVRSKNSLINGEWTVPEKFSSMGNGFTFELESLIFFSIAKACSEVILDRRDEHYIGTYGDDVVVRQSVAPLFCEVAAVLGFIVNEEKSFVNGRFFESCGKHYFDGFDVTPIFLKRELSDIREIYKHHNSLTALSRRVALGVGRSNIYRPCIRFLRSLVPDGLVTFGPEYFGDSVLHEDYQPWMVKTNRAGKFMVNVITEEAVSCYFDGYGLLLDRIRGAPKASDLDPDYVGNLVDLRGVTRPELRSRAVRMSDWHNLGPWI